jgi:replicative DNA helicase
MIDNFENATIEKTRRRGMADPSRVDRLPPHSIENEQGLLGSILLDPVEVLPAVEAKFANIEQPFYDLRHQAIYDAMLEKSKINPAFSIIELQELLKMRQQLEAIGGMVYLSSLPDATPSGSNWPYYAVTVREKALTRSMIQVCTEIVGRAYEMDGSGTVEMFLDEAEREVLGVSDLRSLTDGERTIKELVRLAIDRMERKVAAKGEPTGISTGLPDLDKITSGLHAAEVTIIAARPSEGKTSLAMNIVENVAIENNHHVMIVSLEMLGEALVERMLYSKAKISGRRIATDGATEDMLAKIADASVKIAKSKIHIEDKSSMSVTELRSLVRRKHRGLTFQKQDGTKVSLLKLVVIDYLQLLHGTSKKSQNRTQEIGEISRGIKALAKELGISIILLSQLNREMEREKNRMPRLSDLRECGDIEQDAHNVIFIWDKNKPSEEDPSHSAPSSRNVLLVIAKQREGPRGVVEVFFNAAITRFESAAKFPGATY